MWLFDTVALSEARKSAANAGFVAWLDAVDRRHIFTSVLCLGEIRRGVERLPPSDRRSALLAWLEVGLTNELAGRVCPVDESVAKVWGRMIARRSLPDVDSLIGATASLHGLTVVTRNVRDFDGLGVPVLNPWT